MEWDRKATFGKKLKFMRKGSSNFSSICLNLSNINSNPLENAMVSLANFLIGNLGLLNCIIKGVHILHVKFLGPHEAKARTDFIPVLAP